MDSSARKAVILAVLISLSFISLGAYIGYEAYLVYETDDEVYVLDREEFPDAVKEDEEKDQPALLQICPEAWYENRQPMVFDDSTQTTFTGREGSKFSSQYVIIKGERVEMNEVDISWIMQNCEVSEPELVY